jgi:hypothetical protein
MTAAEIAAALAPDNARRSGQWWRCVCPVHGSRTGHSLSLALRDHPHGLAVRCHAGCSRDEVIAELRRLGLLAERSDGARPPPVVPRDHDWTDTARRIALAQRIWGAARDARRSPVVQYLASRGITIPVPPSLRWAPSLRRPDSTYAPAMVARVDGLDGQLIGVHRTWLTRGPDGIWRCHDRASLGPVGGGAVRFAPATETLLIGEGIETTLAGMVATGLPGWASLSTSGMMGLLLPHEVRVVIILADNDRSGAGERAACTAAQHWLRQGRKVRVYISPHVGEDAADRLLAMVGEDARRAA